MRPPGGATPLFATAIYGVLDTKTREIRLASAGQTPPIHWPARGAPRYLRLKGMPLGARARARYEETALSLAPGDRLLFCSDGFIETPGPDGRMVGYGGFLRQLQALENRSGADLVGALFDASHNAPGEDDRTLVLLRAR
jgi:sigma-B regulation protein RsbU (phosphoserine phosphatase)